MYKLIVIKRGVLNIFRKKETFIFSNNRDIIKAVHDLRNCDYMILDKNDNIIDIEDILKSDKLITADLKFNTMLGNIKIIITIREDAETGKIKTELICDDTTALYMKCFEDDNCYSKLETYYHMKDSLEDIGDINKVYETIKMIFNFNINKSLVERIKNKN